jgi:phage-related protein
VDFLDGIISALGSLASEIAQALVFLFNLLIQVFQFIWDVIQIVAGYVVQVFKAIATFFTHLWDNFFKGVFTKLFQGIGNIVHWVEARLKPIIKFLQAARKYIDKIYKTYVAPFLKIIQHVRQFLQILKLLHIKIAAQLDAILAQVQRDVNGVFLQIRGILNTAIDLLNIVADPSKLLRKPTMVLSLRRTIHAFIRQVTGLPPGWYFPSPRKSAPRGLGFLPANFDPANPDHKLKSIPR